MATTVEARAMIPSGDLDVHWVLITPNAAKVFLDTNRVNRRLRESKVAQYQRDMTEGRWQPSNDAICLSPSGELLNGQHRLTAIVNSGVSVRLLVMYGLPTSAMSVMDSGAARSMADALKLRGEANYTTLASIIRLAMLIDTGRVIKARSEAIGHAELIEYLGDHPELKASAAITSRVRKSIDAPQSAVGTTHWLIGRTTGFDAADHFIHRLAYRTGEVAGSPILAADSRLRELRRTRGAFKAQNYVYMLIKTWNYVARGQSVRVVSMAPKAGAEFYIPEIAHAGEQD